MDKIRTTVYLDKKDYDDMRWRLDKLKMSFSEWVRANMKKTADDPHLGLTN